MFKFVGFVNKTKNGAWQDFHTVSLFKVKGDPVPLQEVKYIKYYDVNNKTRVSSTTKKIIKKYYNWKDKQNLLNRIWINLRYKSKLK